jgi:NAD(P)-dependent dehydrogenase (short-subunit alcohol dehydrogenase family)
VSGFNSGIGFETTRTLLDRGCEVIGISRNEELAWQAVEDLREEFPGAAVSYKVCAGADGPLCIVTLACAFCSPAGLDAAVSNTEHAAAACCPTLSRHLHMYTHRCATWRC